MGMTTITVMGTHIHTRINLTEEYARVERDTIALKGEVSVR